MSCELLLQEMNRRADELYNTLIGYMGIISENFIDYGNELPCAEAVYADWKAMGLEPRMYSTELIGHPGFLPGRTSGNRPNVTAVLHGRESGGRIMLLAHTDTMPVGDAASWTHKPTGELCDGNLYGRGANDDKCGLAALTFIARVFGDLGIVPKHDVLLTAYSDEEYGGGNGALAACVEYPCDAYINLDGGNMEIQNVALGGIGMHIKLESRTPLDSSAAIAEGLYRIMTLLGDFGKRRRDELHANPVYQGTDMERSAFRITGFTAGDMGCDLSSGRLMCSIYTDNTREQIMSELDEIVRVVTPELEHLNLTTEGFRPSTRFFRYAQTEDKCGLFDRLSRASETANGKKLNVKGSCLSDLNILLEHGSKNSFNFGLVRDFMLEGGAHQPNEFIECDRLLEFTRTLAVFMLGE